MNLEKQVVGDIHMLTPRKNLMGGEETRELEARFRRSWPQGAPQDHHRSG